MSSCFGFCSTDVWALGCCLYSLAFLQNCFEEGSNLAILSRNYKIPEDNPYGEGLVELIDRMLTVDSKARSDMTEVILCLSAIYSGRELPPRKKSSKSKKDDEPSAENKVGHYDTTAQGNGTKKKKDPKKPAEVRTAKTSRIVAGRFVSFICVHSFVVFGVNTHGTPTQSTTHSVVPFRPVLFSSTQAKKLKANSVAAKRLRKNGASLTRGAGQDPNAGASPDGDMFAADFPSFSTGGDASLNNNVAFPTSADSFAGVGGVLLSSSSSFLVLVLLVASLDTCVLPCLTIYPSFCHFVACISG